MSDFRTRDFPLAAFLITLGFPLKETKSVGTSLLFCFPPDAAAAAPLYIQGERVSARAYYSAIKDLRRHYGIVLSENGAEIHVIQAMLGHSSVTITEEHYAHFSPHYAARRAFQVLQGRKNGRKVGGHQQTLKSA